MSDEHELDGSWIPLLVPYEVLQELRYVLVELQPADEQYERPRDAVLLAYGVRIDRLGAFEAEPDHRRRSQPRVQPPGQVSLGPAVEQRSHRAGEETAYVAQLREGLVVEAGDDAEPVRAGLAREIHRRRHVGDAEHDVEPIACLLEVALHGAGRAPRAEPPLLVVQGQLPSGANRHVQLGPFVL